MLKALEKRNMKKLNHSFLFKIAILLVLNSFVRNTYIFLLTIIYLLIENRKFLFIFLSVFILSNIYSYSNNDFIKIGIVCDTNEKHAIIDKLLYKTEINNVAYNVGDIVKTNGVSRITDEDILKRNILFINEDASKIVNLSIRTHAYNHFNDYDDYTKTYLKKIVLNDNSYDLDILNIGYGFSFYYLLLAIKRRNSKLSIFLLLLYVIVFGFDSKFYIFIIDTLLHELRICKINRISIEIYFILIINKYLLYDYSILVSLFFSLYYISEFRKDKSVFAIFQSILFNEINLFTLFCFKFHVLIRILLFVYSIFVLLFPCLNSSYLILIEQISRFISLSAVSIRGRISSVSITILFVIYKVFGINNQYIRIFLICFVLLTSLNNPIKHVTFIDVGQGDAILIKGIINEYNVLIDTGSKFNYFKLKRQLYKEGINSIDYLIITHLDEDHSGNVDNLLKDFKIKKTIYNGIDIKIGDELLQYQYLGEHDNENDNSLVYLLEIDNYNILFTGDISKKVENNLFINNRIEDIDILKVSHHGSNSATSKLFLSNCLPRFAVISTSGAYSHPHQEVIDNLNDYLVKTFITKDSGTVTFYFNDIIDYVTTENGEFVIIK